MDEEKRRLIDEVILREWKMFQKVQNEGGRADCQDDWKTFRIMREAQYAPWPAALIELLNIDLMYAEEQGRNLMVEKYARMMISTAPEQFRDIEPHLPVISEEKRALTEDIISIHKSWMEEHARTYPALTARGRVLYTSQDSEWNTSSETYLRGELLTWSAGTLKEYLKFLQECQAEGRNLVNEQDESAVKAYGFESLEEAEQFYRLRQGLQPE